MRLSELKSRINSLIGFIGFDYDGVACGIDPINTHHFEMWYGNDALTAKSIDEVMNVKLFKGKNLIEIHDQITNIDY